jgi:hypothetical protein
VSIYKLFPGDSEDISQKYEILTLFMNLLKKMPDISDSTDFLSLLIVKDEKVVIDGKEVNLFEEFKRKVLRRDRVCESILEKLRQNLAHILTTTPKLRKDLVSQNAVRHYNFLVEMTYKFLDYLENHKRYQTRCSKITSTMNNIIRNEIETLVRETQETIVSIFSLIDDLNRDKDDAWIPFVELYTKFQGDSEEQEQDKGEKAEKLNDRESEDDEDAEVVPIELIKGLEDLILNNDKRYMMQRHSLFDLEKKGVIRNFSFDKGSKFFDM